MTMCYCITFGQVGRGPEQNPKDPKQGLELGNHRLHPYTNPVITKFADSMNASPDFLTMPESTQKLILQIGNNALVRAGISATLFRRPLFWGMYLIGSRARNEHQPNSDTDLLCVGNFNVFGDLSDNASPLHGFAFTERQVLPPSYLVGYTSGKYFLRLLPREDAGSSNLNRVDLSIAHVNSNKVPDLRTFTRDLDVDDQGKELPRKLLLKINVVGPIAPPPTDSLQA